MSKSIRSSMAKKWIAGATENKGSLHRQLGIKPGNKIPLPTLKANDKGGSKLARRARLAETLRSFRR